MDKLQAMKAFVTVVETGGLTSAAKKLDVSTSVVSRLVSELEAALGAHLLTRTTRVVRVTESGAIYVEDCRRILAEIDEAEMTAVGADALPRGQLVVTAPVIFGKVFIVPLLARYAATYPDVDVSCWFLDRVVHMVEEEADIAVRVGMLPDSSLRAIGVGQVRRVICASPRYLEATGAPSHPSELSRHTIISPTGVAPSADWRFADGDRPIAVKVHPRFSTTTNDSAISMATAGLGIASLLSYQIIREVQDGRLKIILADYETAPLPVYLLHRGSRQASTKVRAFLDLAIESLRAHPALFSERPNGTLPTASLSA